MSEDWKDQLYEVYKVVKDRQKNIRKEPSKFDQHIGRKGMKGFSDSGIPLTDAAAKKQQKNKSSYNSRKGNYHFSKLRVINDARAEVSRKYRMTNPEHAELVKKITEKVYEESVKQKEEVIKKVSEQTTQRRFRYSPLEDLKFNSPVPRKNYNYYDPIVRDDTIEVTPVNDVREPVFKNKIDEAIYKLKKEEGNNE